MDRAAGKHYRKYSFNESAFNNIDTPEKAYWLGYMYTDGSITPDIPRSYTLRMQSKDSEHVQKFLDFIQHKITFTSRKDGVNIVQINSKIMVQALLKLGIVPNKTYDHSVPVFIPSGDLEKHFWRGCIDGDGAFSICRVGKNNLVYCAVILTNCNKFLLEACKSFFQIGHIFDLKNTVAKQWRVGPRPLRITLPSLDKIYQDAPVYLERKYQKYLSIRSFSNVT
jgi:hypothetical protein